MDEKKLSHQEKRKIKQLLKRKQNECHKKEIIQREEE